MEERRSSVDLIIDPIVCLLLLDDSKVYEVGKLSLNGAKGKPSLEHDFSSNKERPQNIRKEL